MLFRQLEFTFDTELSTPAPDINRVIENNKGLIGLAIKRLRIRFSSEDERDEAFEYGLVGLWKSAMTFDRARGVKFSTYAFEGVLFSLRRFQHDRRMIKKRNPWKSLDKMTEDLGDSVSGPGPGGASLEDVAFLRNLINALPEPQKEVIRLRYFVGFTFDECSVVLGVSRERVRQREIDAINRLRWLADRADRTGRPMSFFG